METIFNFDWLDNTENTITKPCIKNDNNTRIYIKELGHDIRFGTSSYGGYIVTIKDLDTNESVSFNCGRMDLESEWKETTYEAMRRRFAIYSNGAYYTRNDIKVESVTVPIEKYEELLKKLEVYNDKSIF